MRKISKLVMIILTAVMLLAVSFAVTGCGSVEGTYTKVIASHDYFAAQAVKDDIKVDADAKIRAPIATILSLLCPAVADANGFKTADGVADYYTVDLELSGSSYTFTKQLKIENPGDALGKPEGKTLEMKLVFTGSYEADGDKVTLKAPDRVTGNVVPAGYGAGFSRFLGSHADIDVAKADIDDIQYPAAFFYYFNTMYFVASSDCKDMTVTLDSSNSDALTFSIA